MEEDKDSPEQTRLTRRVFGTTRFSYLPVLLDWKAGIASSLVNRILAVLAGIMLVGAAIALVLFTVVGLSRAFVIDGSDAFFAFCRILLALLFLPLGFKLLKAAFQERFAVTQQVDGLKRIKVRRKARSNNDSSQDGN